MISDKIRCFKIIISKKVAKVAKIRCFKIIISKKVAKVAKLRCLKIIISKKVANLRCFEKRIPKKGSEKVEKKMF